MRPLHIAYLKFILSFNDEVLFLAVDELLCPCLLNRIRLWGMKHTLNLNAATFPSQMSCIGVSSGNGMAAFSSSFLKAMQQPRYPFFRSRLYHFPYFVLLSLKKEDEVSFKSPSVTVASLTTQNNL